MMLEQKEKSVCQSTMSDCELLQLDKATSTVWKYFGLRAKEEKIMEPDKKKRDRVCCNLCAHDFSYVGILLTCGSTLKKPILLHVNAKSGIWRRCGEID